MTSTLRQLTAEWIRYDEAFTASADSDTGEIDPAVAGELAAWFDALEHNTAVKADGYLDYIRHLEETVAVQRAQSDQYQAEADRFKTRAKTAESQVDWLKGQMLAHMLATGAKKLTTATGRPIAVRTNGGKLPVVTPEMIDLSKVPNNHLVITARLDKDAVRLDLERGAELPYAKLGERGEHLRLG